VAANPAIEARQQAEFAFEHVRDLYDSGRLREAFTAAESASTDCESRVGPNAQWCRLLQQVRVQAALRLGWPDRALPALSSLTAMANDSLSPARQALSAALLVRLLAALGRVEEMHALQGRLQGLAEAGSESTAGEQFKVTAALALADASLRLGEAGSALRWADRALRREPNQAVSPRVFAWAHLLHGLALLELGTNDQALASLQRAGAAHRAALGEDHPMTLLFSLNEARALALVGRAQEGRQLLQRAAPRLLEALGADAPTYLNLLRLQAWLAEADLPLNAARQTGSPFPRDGSASQGARLIFN
jgi:tetratricopeptide (TPR) repeat protein